MMKEHIFCNDLNSSKKYIKLLLLNKQYYFIGMIKNSNMDSDVHIMIKLFYCSMTYCI